MHKKGMKDFLTQSGDEYKIIFDKSLMGTLFFDKEGGLVNANQSALHILGIPSLDDVKGINIFDEMHISYIKNELFENGYIKRQIPLNFDNLKKLGIYTPKRSGIAFFDLSIFVIDSGFLIQIQDITEHKKTEDALKKSEKWFKSIVDTSPSLLVIFNAESEVIYVSPNAEEITGYTPEEISQNIWIVHPDDKPMLQELFKDAFAKGKGTRSIEYRSIKKNGEVWWTAATSKLMLDEKENLMAL